MERVDGLWIVSPTDLVGFLACGHLAELDIEVAEHALVRPRRDDPELEVVQRRGLEHEAAYLARLRAEGLTIAEIAPPAEAGHRIAALLERERDTVEAMQAGFDVIYQATFLDQEGPVAWRGHADFLRRVDGPSKLGDYRYEPEDTKLARHVKPSALLQLSQYAEQVERIQGVAPDHIHVILGGQHRDTVRLDEVSAYYRAARDRFVGALRHRRTTYPMPVSHCSVCRWDDTCTERREADDHLCRVAALGTEQAAKLVQAGVPTLKALARSSAELTVPGISAATLAKLRQQARLQAQRVAGEPPPVELLRPLALERGLGALPPPDPGDVFYDIEGDPFVRDGGLEYLHGLGYLDGGLQFVPLWGHEGPGERQAFEQVIDFIVERRRRYPQLHVYHYAAYEPNALGKLMGRYGTREAELDDLLRGEVFVDLYRVVRQGLVIGSPSYSLKKLEPLYMASRTGEITDAGSSIVEYERWLQTSDLAILDHIEAYNRDDVESTWRLRDWLEGWRQRAIDAGDEIVRPTRHTEAATPAPTEDDLDLIAQLRAGSLERPSEFDPTAYSRWLMADLLRWHQREAKPEWWRYFDRVLHGDAEEFYRDTEAIAGLSVVGEPEPDDRSQIWTYAFDPTQEHKLSAGRTPLDPATEWLKYYRRPAPNGPGTLVDIDVSGGTLRLSRSKNSNAPHPRNLIPPKPIGTDEQRGSLRRLAQAVLDHGIDGAGFGLAARQLLGRRPPRIAGPGGGPLRGLGESPVDAAVRLATHLDSSVLPIQGPPGSGKTFTAARMIAALVDQHHTVGITANSHAVIANMLERLLQEAAELGIEIRAMQRISATDEAAVMDPSVQIAATNDDVDNALLNGTVNVVAGTAWLFARPALVGALHTLVVDEAGQLSLANVLAVAPAATNLVLVGDPQQLSQPSKGTHPDGAGASALEHVLHGASTVADDAGLFLDRSWRLHPAISHFISEQVYDGRFDSQPHCATQQIDDGPLVGGAGLRWLPVEHTGNRTSSTEEAEAVARTFEALLGRPWTNAAGDRVPLAVDDIMVVAPYNAQVHLIRNHLPAGARVGTVDKFQGQEAPVVIVSLTASSADEVPRGMEFLYSRNRLNVAVSRAQALCIVVASPALLAVRCRNVAQMRLANMLCRYAEMAMSI